MITPLYLSSGATRPPLRVAVLLDGPAVPRYVAAILEDIARTNFAGVELAIVREAPAPAVADRLPGLIHEVYLRVDRAMGGDGDPLALVAPGVGLAGVDRLEVGAGRPGESPGEPWLPADAIEEIRGRDLDVILRFCAAVPRGEVLGAARHGVWSYHFGGEEEARGGTPFFQQLAERAPTRDVLLEVLEEAPGGGLVLCRSSFGSAGNVLLAQYRHVAFWETTHFVVWKLHDLHERGWEHLRAQAVGAPRPPDRDPEVARPPTTRDMVRFLAPRVGAAIANRVRGERREHGVAVRWRIGLRRVATPFGSTRESTGLGGFRWVDAPAGQFWADPFLVARGGAVFVFFEQYAYERGYGAIGCAEVGSDGSVGPARVCLDLGYHLSFPFVFEHEGETFMIPESLFDGTVTLYRALRFPDAWVPEKVLFRGNATDTTAWREGGRFHFFTTLHDRDDRGMKTMIFVADTLTGAWRVHPANPASSDVRHARNAGAVFRRGGRLFRPTQDCGPRYGHGLNLEEIVTLSDERYEERPWCKVDARALPFAAVGVHSYNVCGDLEAIDACISLGPRLQLPRGSLPR
jgi:hypothetical protein